MKENDKLYDALSAWRDVLWNKVLTRKYSNNVELWCKVLQHHLDATREGKPLDQRY